MASRHGWGTRRHFIGIAGTLVTGTLAASAASAKRQPAPLEVTSPDGQLRMTLSLPDSANPLPRLSLARGTAPLLEPSPLALVLADGHPLGRGARTTGHRSVRTEGEWTPAFGIAARYSSHSNRLEVDFVDPERQIRFAIHLLAHDHGAAFRHVIHAAPGTELVLAGEASELKFPGGSSVWSSRDEGDWAESAAGAIAPVPVPELTASTDQQLLADTPVLAHVPGAGWLCLCESDRLHYPRLMFAPGRDANALRLHLMHYPGRATGYSGPGDTHPAPRFAVGTPFSTPWRVLIASREPAQLIEAGGLVPTLAAPNRLGDTSWIRPGRAIRIRKPYTTARALECVAFAARRKLDYVEFDAHWYGDGTDPSDATRPIAELDFERIMAATRAAGLGMILYVDRVPAMRQLDDILATYRRWGIAGIKFGFVWEGRQEDTDFLYDLIRRCGEHRLLVNLHDNLRPAGLERTLPNYIALEGVRGNEQFPTARHNCTLPFTRNVAGPLDYTICYAHERNRTTNAHQLALAAVLYSPLAFLYWYDEPTKYAGREWPELQFFDECPTTWDATRAVCGAVGDHVVVARRKGDRWFLGALTNENARRLSVPLGFLGSGRWHMQSFGDGAPAAEAWRTEVTIATREVEAGDTIELTLAPSGGHAAIFTPAG
jgi:alpha-glucosidase